MRAVWLGLLLSASTAASAQTASPWALPVAGACAPSGGTHVRPGAPPLPAHSVKAPTLLGEEIMPDGSVSPEGVERVAVAVADAVSAAHRHGVDQLYPFATSAVRDATNRDEIIDRIQRTVGIRPQFLAGEEEARLTYLAAHRWYGWSVGRLLLLDIGGGSMEIALGRDADPELALSLPVGAGRLTRAFLHHDPPKKTEVKALRWHVRDTLGEVVDRLRWEGTPRRIVATSKTFKQLARLAGAPPQREGPFVRRELTIEDVRRWIPRLAGMSAVQRARLRGVSQPRARQLLAGAVILLVGVRIHRHRQRDFLVLRQGFAQIAQAKENGVIQHFRHQQWRNARRFLIGTLVGRSPGERTGFFII